MKKPISIPSPTMVKAANNLIKASGSSNNTELIKNFLLDKTEENQSPKVRKIFNEIIKNELEHSLTLMTQLYAHYFTLEEINKITSFYTTPAGKKLVKNTPEIIKEILNEHTKRAPILLRKLQTQLDKIDY